ncbi:hypothetical protein EW026_g1378 [Hermanssonia centrifuga]|uniref:Hydantoinase n=1 Tax=Hermanssonia centrifuga TaxID=98765 RepID=A0A4S4KRM2_9APHY|nr:hypothetical protein EW026_g1378 [Hermanssonia centrifuga]
MLRIGVDVGGTNTDGVLIDVSRTLEETRGVLAYFKSPTTPNVSDGIEAAVRQVLENASVPPSNVACCPPFIDFPVRLRALTEGHVGYVDGGFEIDGREIAALNERQIIEQCTIIKEKGLRNVVVAGIFSPLDNEGKQEVAAKHIIERELGAVNVVCSRDVGQVGLLERENASILNAAILTFAQRTIKGFQRAMRALDLTCPLFLTQNDGTLTSAAAAARLPIRTFASGPTNSMRGAAFLAGLDDKNTARQGKSNIVVDVGGTTTDVGVLLPSGFPRQAAAFIEVGGVRTNFSMADVQSIGLGGGSIVRVSESPKGRQVSVGPDSVGHHLTRDAKVFGGNVLTSTDIVVASGHADVGNKSSVRDIEAEVVAKANGVIKKLLEGIIDKMKTSPEDVRVLLVGGGGIISPDKLSGVAEIIRPPYFDVANAVGAAMAKVAGEIDTIELLQGRDIDQVIDAIKLQSIEKAVKAGADRVKAAGELSIDALVSDDVDNPAGDDAGASVEVAETQKLISAVTVEEEIESINIEEYRPSINSDRSWQLSELDLEWIAEGCGVLGTGGGGSPYPPFLVARQMLREGKKIPVFDPEDVPEDAIFMRCMFMGSPSVSVGGSEIPASARALMKYMGMDDFAGAISDEIGGGNGIQPMIVAAELGKPVLDADLMGRAYPNMYQSLPGAFNIPGGLWPCAISDGIGNTIIMPSASNPHSVENILRTVTTEMGSRSGVSMAPLTRKTCQEYGITRSVSQAWRIGRAIALCKKRNEIKNVPSAILQLQNGECLFVGKIFNVQREVRKGFTWGSVTIVPLRSDEEEEPDITENSVTRKWGPEDKLTIPFQNENLYAILESPTGSKKILVTVPDLITVLDSQSGSSIGTQDYRYGLRVTVIAIAGHPKWTTTAEGLACGGPSAFGLPDVPFTPIAEYKEPQSVVHEYA